MKKTITTWIKKAIRTAVVSAAIGTIMAMPSQAATKAVTLQTPATGTLLGKTSDTITYTVGDESYFCFKITQTERGSEDKSGELVEKSFDGDMKTTVSVNGTVIYSKGIRKSHGESYTNPVAYAKGTVISIKVEGDANYEKTYCKYNVKVVPTVENNFEKENNDTTAVANSVKQKVTYSGIAAHNNYDYFVFKAPKAGKYKITFNTRLIDKLQGRGFINEGVSVQLVTKSGKILKTYNNSSKKLTQSALKVSKNQAVMKTQKLKKGQKVYLRVTLDSVNAFKNYVNTMYTFKITKA